MKAESVIPILNVSDIQESFAWFEKLGWKKIWDWGDPPGFGAVRAGHWEIFLCQDGQGGRGKGSNQTTFDSHEAQSSDKGVWLCIMVDDADAVHRHCVKEGLEVTSPPTDMPWGLREMNVRHPDGHVLRIGHGIVG
ncbi:MAG TPA: bleomycin resistance family protein [Gemmatimonadaceae bacterium]|nr:bleomycin resistance family protein [Gemmatimonadaceae bacterium]